MKKQTKKDISALGYSEIKERLNTIMDNLEKGNVEMESLEELLEEANQLIQACFTKIAKAEKISKKWLDQMGE